MKKSNDLKFNFNYFFIFLFVLSFITRLIAIIVIDTPIFSDFKTMYDASVELVNGTRNYLNTPYFTMWGYQMGHVLYQALLLKFINSVFFLKIVNCIVSSFIVVMIYLITRKVTNETCARISSIFYSFFPFPLFLNTVLTNQHFSMLFILIGIYILLNIDYNKFLKNSILVGLLIGLGNILRSEGIIFIFSIFLYYIFLLIKNYNIKSLIYSFLLIFISYSFIFNCSSFIIEKCNLSINGLNNMNTTWKFVLGFNYETNGMYSSDDALLYADDPIAAKNVVIERLKSYEKIPLLFLKKIKILWLNSDLSWSLSNTFNSTIYRILNNINQLFIYVLTLLSSFSILNSILNLFKKKLPSNEQFLITIILGVYFGVYLLIEVMPRYAYSLQIFETILLGISLNLILKKLNKSIL